ncbi:MAG: DsbC family protein [Methylococcaceae bacterium]|nr:DsbC family protein [Methylococcaceae bacterium]
MDTRKTVFALLLASWAGITFAENKAGDVQQTLSDIAETVKFDGMRAIPVSGLQMVKANGRTFFMSNNGRFVFTGTMMDMWNREQISELEQVDTVVNRIDLSKMKLKLDDLGPIDIGTGTEPVVVFVDPQCPHCKTVQDAMAPLKDRYTFRLVTIPILGRESQDLVVRLECLRHSAPDQARDALMTHAYDAVPKDGNCDKTARQKAFVTAHMFDITSVPFLIAPDGRTFKGAPRDLKAWLENTPAQAKAATATVPDLLNLIASPSEKK